ncbi:MAG: MarR family transcriptional regulator [Devosia sp.]|uniref:MarR family winged helix-turn-helix transcriptional regulator n=1 Tax=Devosia sp. TaxID=1871048 RepID=UPI0024C63D50|nr:MarR family transcriptional regulator [Devosia sp.]UYO01002.1 MAG: MarR family transcriptional regulator [Devosia sp.]
MNQSQSLADAVTVALVHMIQRAEDATERAARQGGLHPTDFRCIGFLYRSDGPASPKDIIAFLGLTSGSGTALLDRLEQAGYISRIPNPDDRRGVLIVLNADKAADIIALHLRISDRYVAATADLSDENLRAIATYLRSIEALSEEVNHDLYDTAPAAQNGVATQTSTRPNSGERK